MHPLPHVHRSPALAARAQQTLAQIPARLRAQQSPPKKRQLVLCPREFVSPAARDRRRASFQAKRLSEHTDAEARKSREKAHRPLHTSTLFAAIPPLSIPCALGAYSCSPAPDDPPSSPPSPPSLSSSPIWPPTTRAACTPPHPTMTAALPAGLRPLIARPAEVVRGKLRPSAKPCSV